MSTSITVRFNKTFTDGTLIGLTVPVSISYPNTKSATRHLEFVARLIETGKTGKDYSGSSWTASNLTTEPTFPRA